MPTICTSRYAYIREVLASQQKYTVKRRNIVAYKQQEYDQQEDKWYDDGNY